MKTSAFFSVFISLAALSLRAQVYTPVAVTGHNLDAVAESVTALSTTGGAIDGSDYVLYSEAYATAVSSTGGIPNSGVIASGTNTYQLQPYTQNNMLYVPVNVSDSLTLTTPASYAGLSLLAFATEGTGTMSLTIRFTDNTTEIYSNQTVADWFNTGNVIISGFGRCGRNSGTTNLPSGQPKMFSYNFTINCLNRQKLVQRVIVRNVSANARLCIMGVSGVGVPVFTPATAPVSCAGGTNGSATITPAGGITPFTYTIGSTPAQFVATPSNLLPAVYSYTAQDVAACPVVGNFTILTSTTPLPPLSVTAHAYTVCAGSTVSLATSGANTYTWSTTANSASVTVVPQASAVFSVNGITSANCLRTGTVAVHVNPLPVLAFSSLPASFCTNSPCFTLSASPAGGIFAGTGIQGNTFCASGLPLSSYSVSYSYTDANSCSATATAATVIHPLPAVSFTLSPGGYCTNGSPVTLGANPSGGTFSGPGVSGQTFSPSVAGPGSQNLSYAYTDANSCTSQTVISTTVYSNTPVSFTLARKFYCTSASNAPLNASPSTGVYSGPGVNGQFFSPSTAGAGTHTIHYTFVDGNNCTTVAFSTVTVSTCSGMSEEATGSLSIFPNPGKGAFVIRAVLPGECMLFNNLGQLVQTKVLNEENNFTASFSELPDGIYTLTGTVGQQSVRQKIVVAR